MRRNDNVNLYVSYSFKHPDNLANRFGNTWGSDMPGGFYDMNPTIQFDKNDGSFTFTYSVLSSYFSVGKYESDGKTLTLRTDDDMYTYVFDIEDENLVFNAAKSSPIPEYGYSSSSPDTYCPVPDGAVFAPNTFELSEEYYLINLIDLSQDENEPITSENSMWVPIDDYRSRSMFSLDKVKETFCLSHEPMLSHVLNGKYEFDGKTLTLKIDNSSYTYVFTVKGEYLVYDMEKSSPPPREKLMPDGAVFIPDKNE